jgi:ABC-type glutathione transport system ATPase component
MALLEVNDLHVGFRTRDGLVHAVDGASFSVDRGRALGIVGESGSGKSVSALTVLGLTSAPNATISGSIVFDGVELVGLDRERLREIRGSRIAMIFQDPMSSLHPLYKGGRSSRRSSPTRRSRTRRRTAVRSKRWRRSACRALRSASRATRTSSRAGCASAR